MGSCHVVAIVEPRTLQCRAYVTGPALGGAAAGAAVGGGLYNG
ncbi:MAG: hypothetical protein WA743_11205 [Pseudolabrys sp.]